MDRTDTLAAVNSAIGLDAFTRLYSLPEDIQDAFTRLLIEGHLDMHRDGYAGFTAELPDGTWANEGFELSAEPATEMSFILAVREGDAPDTVEARALRIALHALDLAGPVLQDRHQHLTPYVLLKQAEAQLG